ncbi:MAG: hypothetical protein A2504_09610 [Bdellovibrionales bacterium RIFOXYD12_FULL_39_22]|nr:MAG: hypothetical protein A2385_13100 [Bdellovibrionales bacterium RIFOXYB1_FULL_39_21]OFZ40983.1 MAG: hypothetical protein A2485_16610 [Bdellovibrionales bacterium RIFOXYC12_FULL_39_17]OFZ44811.1 MAG: hypothetical protein A2404_09900 [Bdellovibrionales bacterium RIFOXYC1_FULL_39_130]OFZ74090.1 MAG: hypothetical protein A2451_14550 [Bdellovibrionales bacterium RIFOXYC2_FULL_39_8]OFZ74276.1 MAG: hypothetical protein A2560_16865 [Bdellovibrionales bacterium RIFOXYD1_FULL_39_84]OFZ92140.1 MAG:
MSYYGYWPKYVSVREKQKKAADTIKKLQKKGEKITPITIEGKKIANTFWGKAWCEHLESFSDYANRLPRGRSYVKNGYVVHLGIRAGEINALVQGSSLYRVSISITATAKKRWEQIVKSCVGKIDSLLDLLHGKLSKSVMEVMTHKQDGLFPRPKEIELSCSCPDGAYMCKHVAAVMYGVGAKFDNEPELLFLLRQVDQADLIAQATKAPAMAITAKSKSDISDQNLQNIFGIEIDTGNFTADDNHNKGSPIVPHVAKKNVTKKAAKKSPKKIVKKGSHKKPKKGRP